MGTSKELYVITGTGRAKVYGNQNVPYKKAIDAANYVNDMVMVSKQDIVRATSAEGFKQAWQLGYIKIDKCRRI